MHLDEVPLPELAPDEVLIAMMASSINFNTVWTSIFEPRADVRLPVTARQGARPLGQAPRPAVPRRRQRRRRRRAARGIGRAKWKPGDRGHRALQPRRRPGSRSATTTRCSTTNQRIWGYETNYGGLGEVRLAKANQLMPKPAHLTWEEAASTRSPTPPLPHAREPERRPHAAGRRRARSGAPAAASAASRRSTCSTAAARRCASCRAPSGPRSATRWAPTGDRPQGARGLPVLEPDDRTPEPEGVAAARQDDPRS